MRPRERRAGVRGLVRILAIAAAATGPWLAGGRAQAQWGFGWGWGGGWGGGGISNYMTLSNINQRSMAAANAAYAERARGPYGTNVYANNPNSYINHIRDDSFTPRFEVSTRRTLDYRAQARSTPPPSTRPTQPAPAPQPEGRRVLPLASFFSAAGALVWPREAPTEGALASKRGEADEATAGVYREVKDRGYAPVGLVTDARTKLIEYGQPALDYLRQHTTSAVADSYHNFLLSLYDAVGAAAYPGGVPTR